MLTGRNGPTLPPNIDSAAVQVPESASGKMALTLDDVGTWKVHTLGAIYIFRLSDDPKTVERVPITGGPIPTSDTVRILEAIKICQVGLPGYWDMRAARDPADRFSGIALWAQSSQIQRIEPVDPSAAS